MQVAEQRKKVDDVIKQVKPYWYGMWFVALLVNSALVIGYYYQDKAILRGVKTMERRKLFDSYQY